MPEWVYIDEYRRIMSDGSEPEFRGCAGLPWEPASDGCFWVLAAHAMLKAYGLLPEPVRYVELPQDYRIVFQGKERRVEVHLYTTPGWVRATTENVVLAAYDAGLAGKGEG